MSEIAGAKKRTRMQTLGEAVSRGLAKTRGNGGRPAHATQRPPDEIFYVNNVDVAMGQQPSSWVEAKSQQMLVVEEGILSAMGKDGKNSQNIAKMIRDGSHEIRYYRNGAGDTSAWHAGAGTAPADPSRPDLGPLTPTASRASAVPLVSPFGIAR